MVVPKTQNYEAFTTEPLITPAIIFHLFLMLPAVNFDDQFWEETDEINDVIPNRLLPLEFQAEKAASAQVIPQSLLGLGLI